MSVIFYLITSGCRKRRSVKGVRSLIHFGHFSVTFSVTSSVTFSVTFFAKLLLPDSFCSKVITF